MAPINTVKHYVQDPSFEVATSTIREHVVVDAVTAPATSSAAAVKEGSIVKAVYIERWLGGKGSANVVSLFNLTVEKKRDLEPSMTFAQSQNLGAYPNKKNILYTTQGNLSAQVNGSPHIPVIRNYIAIPKGKQRFGLDD